MTPAAAFAERKEGGGINSQTAESRRGDDETRPSRKGLAQPPRLAPFTVLTLASPLETQEREPWTSAFAERRPSSAHRAAASGKAAPWRWPKPAATSWSTAATKKCSPAPPTEIRDRFGVAVTEVPGDVADPAVQKQLLAACPQPDILVNNNGGPPFRPFSELNRKAILKGVTNNMVAPLELIQAVIGGMAERGFGRIVNITSLSVYMPIPGLDLSSGARAGLTSFLAGVARTVVDKNVTINHLLPGKLDTDRLRGPHEPGSVEDPAAGSGAASLACRQIFRPSGSARRKSSARSAPSSARSTPAI